jgi:hypothetical protein
MHMMPQSFVEERRHQRCDTARKKLEGEKIRQEEEGENLQEDFGRKSVKHGGCPRFELDAGGIGRRRWGGPAC